MQDALTELQAQVRKEPANPRYRIFLFQLLAVRGQWERALNQLNVVGEMDATSLPMVQTYREAIRCELLRAEVFAGRRSPLVKVAASPSTLAAPAGASAMANAGPRSTPPSKWLTRTPSG